jgi:lysozyme family protein
MKIDCIDVLAVVLVGLNLATEIKDEVIQQVEPEPPKKVPVMGTISEFQKALNDHFDAKLVVDGKFGPKTMEAIRKAETFLNLAADGQPDIELFEALNLLEGLVHDITPEVEEVKGGIKSTAYSVLKDEYQALWNTCSVTSSKYLTSVKASILSNQARYESVSKTTGVPWKIIAVIHRMECGGSFQKHLHNGDPLTAKTVQVPAGRPKTGTPPFKWEESAIDALGYDGLTKQKDWSVTNSLFFLEKYNGWGYRNGAGQATTPTRRSPYLWAATNHYVKGKYIADGKFDPEAVSQQIGAAALLKMLNYA